MATIEVLLATYNGAKYLEPLLESLRTQTFADFRVIARDDGSTDATLEILERHPWVQLHIDRLGGLGASGNFGALLAQATAPYVTFCDQDDVWLPEKLERMHCKMAELEALHGSETPLLLHSDLRVVDANLEVITDSFWIQQHFNPHRDELPTLLVQNRVTGCATMVNRALYRLALPIPPEATMHDAWLALVACGLGKMVAIPQPLILYRQHTGNTVGAQSMQTDKVVRKLLEGFATRAERMARRLYQSQLQAQCLARRYADRLPPERFQLIQAYADFPELSPLEKRLRLLRYGLGRDWWLRQLALWVYV